jgi:hypothetical protein
LEGTNDGGWFLPMNESNCIFLLRRTYNEIGGFDERFDVPGGGLVNLDFYYQLCEHPKTDLIILLSEGSFHQIHGGVATNNANDAIFDESLKRWIEQYKTIRGKNFKPSVRRPVYWGDVVPEVVPFLNHSIKRLAEHIESTAKLPATLVAEKEQVVNTLSSELDYKEAADLIRSSGLFDEKWYLAKNADVQQAKMDPVLNYLRFGGFEGRDPSPSFNSRYYFNTYPDVKNARFNPLLHYLKHGKSAGYKSQPESTV